MKQYMAVFLGSASSEKKAAWDQMDPKQRQEREQAGMKAWGQWAEKNQNAIVERGAPLGKTKLVNARGVADTKNLLTAYTVVQAESHEAAARLFVEHPHFTIFPGDAIEIMECLPMPGT